MQERDEQPKPKAIIHIGRDTIPIVNIPTDMELSKLLEEIDIATGDFFRSDGKEVTYEIVRPQQIEPAS